MTWSTFRRSLKRIALSWQWYLFSSLFMVSATSFEKTGVYSEFLLWLKSTKKYTPSQINYYPSIFTTVAIVSTYALTVMSDRTNNRFIVNPIMFGAVFISCIMLLVWNIPVGAHWFAYIIAGFGYAGQASNVSLCVIRSKVRAHGSSRGPTRCAGKTTSSARSPSLR